MQEVTRIWEAAADAINKEHRLARESAETAVDHAIRCGQLLIEKKKTLAHGEWIPWIEHNCEFHINRANRYMRAANCALTHNFGADEKLALSREIWGNKPNYLAGTGENEWHTPQKYIEATRKVLGSIELDPASSDKAQEIVRAKRYFTVEDNGLNQSWKAETVFLNPPYWQEVSGAQFF